MISYPIIKIFDQTLTMFDKPDRQWRSSSFQESKKVRISRDLWPWPWPWAHPGCTLTRRPSCASLVAIRPIVCEKKRFAQKFTDRRTDRRRTPRHCISSFLWHNRLATRVFQLCQKAPRVERCRSERTSGWLYQPYSCELVCAVEYLAVGTRRARSSVSDIVSETYAYN